MSISAEPQIIQEKQLFSDAKSFPQLRHFRLTSINSIFSSESEEIVSRTASLKANSNIEGTICTILPKQIFTFVTRQSLAFSAVARTISERSFAI